MIILKCQDCGRTHDDRKGREVPFACLCGGSVLIDLDDESAEDALRRARDIREFLTGTVPPTSDFTRNQTRDLPLDRIDRT